MTAESVVLGCPQCRRFYRIPRATASSEKVNLRCTGCGHVFSPATAVKPGPAPEGPKVLIATDGEEVRSIIEQVLHRRGYLARAASEGGEAWRQVESWEPRAMVLDVGLPGIPVFEICNRVRQTPKYEHMCLILLASVYQHTRYKRSPTSLYGADDYIEKHHLKDSLIGKIEAILSGRVGREGKTPAEPPPTPPHKDEAGKEEHVPDVADAKKEEETLVKEEKFGSADSSPAGEKAHHEILRRFARLIVSDIALYNQEAIEQGIREGNLTQLLEREIKEGLALYKTRLPADAGSEKDFYRQAFDELIATQRARFKGQES